MARGQIPPVSRRGARQGARIDQWDLSEAESQHMHHTLYWLLNPVNSSRGAEAPTSTHHRLQREAELGSDVGSRSRSNRWDGWKFVYACPQSQVYGRYGMLGRVVSQQAA
ncbi:predicted protein [Histoplasma capsulatum G186AR]|uniref:Uncharacterized protein n=1 Tax=Ajellomyces capsulatus (strain G186AR / H82 / ATCC MYA-2454 / RMSCC 2432) TaxID=447093 RepID=C0P0E6_AJECG|nr:uncharacterized protein HCBG_08865 [Histoplasma capsulatum G186AR]EEH02962.1 predicted protein [Histoplasma capsulatum G186AR]